MTADLRKRLLSQEPVAFLIQTILKPLNRPTGKNQWSEFAVKVCQKLKVQANLAGREVNPQELLDEMHIWLDRITRDEKVKAELADDARQGACRSSLGATAFEKKMLHQMQLLEAEDIPYSDVGEVAAGILLADSQVPKTSKKRKKSKRKPASPSSIPKNFTHLGVAAQPLNPGWGNELLVYKVLSGMTKSYAPAYPQVLVTQDSLEHARAWQGRFLL